MENLQLCLRLLCKKEVIEGPRFMAEISFAELDLVVQATGETLKDAVDEATRLCAKGLQEEGYAATQSDVKSAIEEALLTSDKITMAPAAKRTLN